MSKKKHLFMYTARIEIVDIQAINKTEALKELNKFDSHSKFHNLLMSTLTITKQK